MQIDCVLPFFHLLSRKWPPILRMIVFSISFLFAARPEFYSRALIEVGNLALIFTVGQANGATPPSLC